MDEEDVIQEKMGETRAALTEKLEILEEKLTDTVQGASENVSQTVEAVKDTVQETVANVREAVEDTFTGVKETVQEKVEAVKQFFDLAEHVRNHPWTMVAGSIAVGYFLGKQFTKSYVTHTSQVASQVDAARPLAEVPQPPEIPHRRSHGNGRHHHPREKNVASSGLLEKFSPELGKLKGLAVGAFMGALRKMIKETVPPPLESSVSEIIDSATVKIGGIPINM